MTDEPTTDPGIFPLSGEAPIDWLVRIAPEGWEPTEEGYKLILQSGDRRVVVETLENQAVWQERIGSEEIGTRWVEREVIEGCWYIQTTAGMLLWGVGDASVEGSND
jgi:hypothetical protein